MRKKGVLRRQTVKGRRKRQVLGVFGAVHVIGSGLFVVVFMGLILGLMSVAFLSFSHFLLTSPCLKLEQVVVKGVDHGMREKLVDLAGLNTGQSLLALNLRDVKLKMERHPWIRRVNVERKFPHTLVVEAERQKPCAFVAMDKLYYVNGWGEVFGPFEMGKVRDLPVITGVSKNPEKAGIQLKEAIKVLGRLNREEGALSSTRLSEIHINQYQGMSLYFDHLKARIRLSAQHVGQEIENLRKVIRHLSRKGRLGQAVAIELDSINAAVVSFTKGET